MNETIYMLLGFIYFARMRNKIRALHHLLQTQARFRSHASYQG